MTTSKIDGVSVSHDAMAGLIQRETHEFDPPVNARRRQAPQQSLDPRGQLACGEGFRYVIIGAGVKTANLVAPAITRGHRLALAQAADPTTSPRSSSRRR